MRDAGAQAGPATRSCCFRAATGDPHRQRRGHLSVRQQHPMGVAHRGNSTGQGAPQARRRRDHELPYQQASRLDREAG